MPSIDFKPQFVPLIENRTKQMTLRRAGQRQWKPGDRLHMFTGQRTRHCRKIGEAEIISVKREIILDESGLPPEWETRLVGRLIIGPATVTYYSGFANDREFLDFHKRQGNIGENMTLIFWGSSFKPA